MPYQGVAFFFVLGVGIATAALMYLLREQERLEQPYAPYSNTGYRGGSTGEGNDSLHTNWPRLNEQPSSRRRRRQNRSNGSAQICAICQDEMKSDGLPCKRLNCDHSFHRRCIEQWAERKRECPCCRVGF